MGQRQAAETPSTDWDGGVPPGGSPLERALHAIVGTFGRYAGGAGGAGEEPGLDPPQFRRLLQRELGHQLLGTRDGAAVAALFSRLDGDGDGRVTFAEFWPLLAWLGHVLWHHRDPPRVPSLLDPQGPPPMDPAEPPPGSPRDPDTAPAP